jgi:hypothetical protein
MLTDADILNSIMVPVAGDVPIPTDIGKPIDASTSKIVVEDPIASLVKTEGKPANSASVTQVFSEDVKPESIKPESVKSQNLVDIASVGGPWKSAEDHIDASFVFNNLFAASKFLYQILSECDCCGHSGVTAAISPPGKTEDDGDGDQDWVVNIQLGPISSEVVGKNLRVAQLASYLHTKITNVPPSPHIAYGYGGYEPYSDNLNSSDSKQVLEEDEEILKSWMDTFEQLNQLTLSEADKVIKVPFCRIGEWTHPIYGKLTFTQQDLDDIVSNFNSQIIGYEPPLFLGHPVDGATQEGHPAEGFLHRLEQEDDVLYGLFEMVNEETYSSVSSGRYRYSSGEFVRNYTSKESGKPVGTVLVGVALTNRPFLTGLPRVSTLAESAGDNTVASLICLTETMTTQTENKPNTPATEVVEPSSAPPAVAAPAPAQVLAESAAGFEEFKKSMLADFASLKEVYSSQIADATQRLAQYEVKLTAQEAEIQLLRDKATSAEQKLRDTEIEHKLAELNKLVLPEEVREKYSELIKSGALGDQESVVMDTLRAMSASRVESATGQRGDATAQTLSDPNSDPYAAIIERNAQMVKAREQQLLANLTA